MSPTRRALLKAAVGGAAAGLGAGGCGSAGNGVQAVVVWSGQELEQFRRVVARYDRPVDVISGGDNIDALLRARRAAGNSPDVAVVSRPALIARYAEAGWLAELDDSLAAQYAPLWQSLVRDKHGVLYGVWVKAAHKSLIWRRLGRLPQPPQDWPSLVTLVRQQAAAGPRPPLAMAAADGWVLTDWLENRLAALLTKGLYDDLAGGADKWKEPPVERAFTDLAELWSIEGAFPGGGRRALLTQMEDAVLQVVTTDRAGMVFEGDFVGGVVNRFRPPAAAAVPFPFPGEPQKVDSSAPPPTPPIVVGGDAAVVFRGSTEGERLVRWLVEPITFQPWIDSGGYLTPNTAVDSYPDQLSYDLATRLKDAGQEIRFDLSDQLPGALTGADGQGSWQILQDFFADVTVRKWTGDAAVTRVTDRLNAAVRAIRAGR